MPHSRFTTRFRKNGAISPTNPSSYSVSEPQFLHASTSPPCHTQGTAYGLRESRGHVTARKKTELSQRTRSSLPADFLARPHAILQQDPVKRVWIVKLCRGGVWSMQGAKWRREQKSLAETGLSINWSFC